MQSQVHDWLNKISFKIATVDPQHKKCEHPLRLDLSLMGSSCSGACVQVGQQQHLLIQEPHGTLGSDSGGGGSRQRNVDSRPQASTELLPGHVER